jgi:beta-barrel assembly-enhancing protease
MKQLFCWVSALTWIWTMGFVHIARAQDSGASVRQETALWQLAVEEQTELEQHRKVLEDTPLGTYVQAVVMRLWRQVASDLDPMQVRVLVDTAANAVAYPNGVCYLTSGMLANLRNEDQLAMILAHEMIHYTRRHTLATYNRLMNSAAFDGGTVPLADGGQLDFQLVEKAEGQADSEGFELIRRAGFCPHEAVAVLLQSLSPTPLRNPAVPAASFHARAEQRAHWVHTLIEKQKGAPACGDDPSADRRYSLHVAGALLADAQWAVQQGRWKLADEDIQRYLTVCPTDPRAHFLDGEIQRLRPAAESTGSPEAAYLEAIRLDHRFGPAYQALGVLYFKAGRLRDARPFFERFLSLAPQSEESVYIRRYLQLCSR